jgi:hypothetical protein
MLKILRIKSGNFLRSRQFAEPKNKTNSNGYQFNWSMGYAKLITTTST